MLNTIVKLIGIGVIIGLNGLNALGNRVDVFYENGPTLVAEGIDGIELPQELSDPSHELWEEYIPYVKFIGIRLNFPEELIADCEDKYWKIHDESLIQELEDVVSSEENFHDWCDKQKEIRYPNHNTGCIHTYIFKKANEKNYLIPKDFCKRTNPGATISRIHLKGITFCLYGLEAKTPTMNYLGNLKGLIRYICR